MSRSLAISSSSSISDTLAIVRPTPTIVSEDEEAKAQRLEEKTEEFKSQGLPDAPARLRAQLGCERWLPGGGGGVDGIFLFMTRHRHD